MSHKTECQLELNNKYHLMKALDKLGLKYTEAQEGQVLYTKGRYGVKEKVDILVHAEGDAVGFRRNENGTYTAIGDFMGVRSKTGISLDAKTMGCEVTALSKESEMAEHLMNIGFNEAEGRKETRDYIEVTYERWG